MLKLVTRHTLPFLFLLALGVFGVGLYLAPSHQEIALMQMDDFDFNIALKNFTTLHSAGDRSINVLAPLINLNIYYGNEDQAIALVESFVADHPRSVEGHKRLAELYKDSQRVDHYCQELEALQNLAPSAANLRDLADTYDFLGRYKDEMNALAQLTESRDYTPHEEDYIKLASLYRIDNQPDEAIRTIRDYIEDHYYKVGIDAVTLGVQLLLEQDETRQAFSMARNYLKKRGTKEDALALSVQFETQGQINSAYDILLPFSSDMGQSPGIEERMVDIMLKQKRENEVYAMLSAQRENQGLLSPPLTAALTDLATGRSDYAMIETLIRTQDLNKLLESLLLRYAEISFQIKRPDLARFMLTKLDADHMREAPELAAILAVATDDTPKSMAMLDVLPRAGISPDARIIAAGIYMAHNMPRQAFEMVDGMPIAELFNTFDPAQYAELYLDAQAGPKAEQILNEARAGSQPEIQDAIDRVLVLLASGEGKSDIVKRKLADYKGSVNDFWPDAYDIAIRYHHNDIALAIAERMYKIDPDEIDRLNLAETLLINQRYGETLSTLQSLIEKNPVARAMYLDAMVTWSEQSGGAPPLSNAQKSAFNEAVESILKSPNVEPGERRDLASVLEQIGFLDQATNILVSLAGEQPRNSPDVENLIGFWQDHPSEAAKEWITNRARHASNAQEQALWLADLNDINDPQAVVAIVQNTSAMPAALFDQYIEALASLHDKEQLELHLDEAIDTERNPDRLRKMTKIAQDEDVNGVAEKGWRKLYALNSSNDEAAKEIALIDFDANRYQEAKPLFNQYFQHNQGDYFANLAYGEILQQDDENSEAESHFQRALQQLSDIKERDQSTEEDEAYLLYQTGNVTDSLAHYRRLLAQYPNDKALRADFAEVLMEVGQYDEASSVLAR